jgi:hypothetical protein
LHIKIPNLNLHELQQPRRLRPGLLSGPRGHLGFLEYKGSGSPSADSHGLPFEPKRIYWVDSLSENGLRGDHAHLNSSRVVVAVKGSVRILITFKDGRTKEYELKTWDEALWIPPGFWYECRLDTDSLLLVIASHPHEQDQYLRDKEAYLSGYIRNREWIYAHNYLPQVYKRSYPLHHYGMRRYQYIARKQVTEVFYLAKGSEILGRWPFQIDKEWAISLPNAPYGGLQVNESVPSQEIIPWLEWVKKTLYGMGIKKIRNRCKPDFLMSSFEKRIMAKLEKVGFKESFSDSNQFLSIKGPLQQRLHAMELRKLSQCRKLGYKLVEESPALLEEVYYFIAQARANRNIPLSITYDQMQQFFMAYPEKYRIMSIFDKKNLRLATCIVVNPEPDTLYYFLPATAISALPKSPMVLLIAELYHYCQSRSIRFLDLGLSSVEGHVQQGLFDFKQNMGAYVSPKRTFDFYFDK